ncbi:MAG: DUF948 domain-containing protein [Nitrospirae bacterium]|nr:MAG: DUF948 domain-containing protein [Nitrospirota bacterium]
MEIYIGVITLVVVVVGGFAVYTIIEARRTLKGINEFIKTTEEELNPTIKTLRETLENLNSIIEDIQTMTGSTRQIGENLRDVSEKISETIESVTEVKKQGRATVVALKAGIREGFKALIRNLTT